MHRFAIHVPYYIIFVGALNVLAEKLNKSAKPTSKHIWRSTSMFGRNVTIAFGTALIAILMKIPLVYIAFVFASIIVVRIFFCCLRQPIQDTSTKFKDEAFSQPKDDIFQLETTTQMLFHLRDALAPARIVGGKAASLMKLHGYERLSMQVPNGFALSVAFFQPWVDTITTRVEWKVAEQKNLPRDIALACTQLRNVAKSLPLSEPQAEVLKKLRTAIDSWPGLSVWLYMAWLSQENTLFAIMWNAINYDRSSYGYVLAGGTMMI